MPSRAGRDLFYIHFLEVYSQIKDFDLVIDHKYYPLIPFTGEIDY